MKTIEIRRNNRADFYISTIFDYFFQLPSQFHIVPISLGTVWVAILHFGDQSAPVFDNHGFEVVERGVSVHGAHAVDFTVVRGEA